MSVGEFLVAHWLHWIALAGLVGCSAFFSGSETAFFSLTAAELLRLRQGEHRLGHLVAAVMRRPHRLLMVILLGNQLANVAFFAVSASILFDFRTAFQVTWVFDLLLLAVPVLLIILLGEVAPKNLAIVSPGRFAQVLVVPLTMTLRVLAPLQRLLSVLLIDPLTRLFLPSKSPAKPLTGAELTAVLELASHRRHLTPNESAWLREVIELGRLKVGDIMVPRVDVVAYDVNDPPAGLIELFRAKGFVKVPLYDGDIDRTLGVVFAKDLLLTPHKGLRELVKPVVYVPESGTVDKLLQQFRRTRSQVAIVVDEYGGTAGLVTLEDAMEEVVGEIASPDEPMPEPVKQIGPNEYLILGDLAIHEWLDAFGIDLPAERISTVGGLVMSLLGRVPQAGDAARWRNLHFTVEAVRRRRIAKLRVQVLEDSP